MTQGINTKNLIERKKFEIESEMFFLVYQFVALFCLFVKNDNIAHRRQVSCEILIFFLGSQLVFVSVPFVYDFLAQATYDE